MAAILGVRSESNACVVIVKDDELRLEHYIAEDVNALIIVGLDSTVAVYVKILSVQIN